MENKKESNQIHREQAQSLGDFFNSIFESADKGQQNQIEKAAAQSAEGLFVFYRALRTEGFTEDQAMYLLGQMIKTGGK